MMMTEVNMDKLEALAGKVVGDASAALGILLNYIGDQTGVFNAMADGQLRTAKTLAEVAKVDSRYLQEMLSASAANGYVTYDNLSNKFSLSAEQAAVLAHEDSSANMQGLMQIIVAQYAEFETAIDVFKTGKGRAWSEHHACLFCGTDRFFRPGYEANLIDQWLPALSGVQDKLQQGGSIADIGCGHGSSSLLLAKAFPKSTVYGSDNHAPSIASAKEKSRSAELDNLHFEVACATELQVSGGFDLACIFDALHDMGDPVGAAQQIRKGLKPGGTLMVVEPMAGDQTEDNLHALGGVFYAASTLVCLPASRSQNIGLCLGAQAGPARITSVLEQAGFSSVRIAAKTPTNLVFEAIN